MQAEAKPVIVHTFQVIGDLADNVREEGTSSKKLCHESIREYTHTALYLLPIYVGADHYDARMCEEAFTYFKIVLDVLKSQMGADSVEQIIHSVLTLFSKDQLSETVRNEGSTGVRVVERLLEVLQLVVKGTDLAFRR